MRLDRELVARGLARSRTQAVDLLAAGRVRVDGRIVTKASRAVAPSSLIEAEADPWVSRAAHKLLGALEDSATRIHGRVLDAGASTGGFTQVALDRGATRVYAVDVGHGQLAEAVRSDPRVTSLEGLNLRDLVIGHLDNQSVNLIVGDVSFISLRLLLEPLLGVLNADGQALLLVKPQFEVGRAVLGNSGVVCDARLRAQAVDDVIAHALSLGWRCDWRGDSRLVGSGGNIETFIRLAKGAPEDGSY